MPWYYLYIPALPGLRPLEDVTVSFRHWDPCIHSVPQLWDDVLGETRGMPLQNNLKSPSKQSEIFYLYGIMIYPCPVFFFYFKI